MTPKQTLASITLALTTVIIGTAPILPPEPTDVTVTWAETHRKYLNERMVYMTTQKDIQKIPEESLSKAVYAKDNFEDILIDEGLVNEKGGKIELKRQTIIEKVTYELQQVEMVQRAYAFTFGKEDFESCGSLPCSFDSQGGAGFEALDATSKINGADSLRCDITGSGNCFLRKNLASDDEYYFQFYVLLPTGWTFGAAGYAGLWQSGDGVGLPVFCNIEDYGSIRITCAGDELGYTDTGINIPLNTPTKLEFKVRISATTGDVDIWVNNDTEGSPNYNGSGTMNTGSQNITTYTLGSFFPNAVNDLFYDDAIVDTAFIGAGVVAEPAPQPTMMGGLNLTGGVSVGAE
jgi:hypothetical protein